MSGYTAQQIRDRYFANRATACNGEECGTILVQGGVNSLKANGAITGVVEQAALNTMLEIVDDALARGRRVMWVGVLPYAGCDSLTCPGLTNPGLRARTYNSLMATACAARPAVKCSIPYAIFESPPDYLAPAYACADGIHLDDQSGKTGPQTLAAKILTALGY